MTFLPAIFRRHATLTLGCASILATAPAWAQLPDINVVLQRAHEEMTHPAYERGGPNDTAAVIAQALKQLHQTNTGTALQLPNVHGGGVDLRKLLEESHALPIPGNHAPRPVRPRLLVFFSFSMPEEGIKRLLLDASRAGATITLRGFKDGSLHETEGLLAPLFRAGSHAISISPADFKRYHITSIPAVVIARDQLPEGACGTTLCPSADYVKVAGDVSVGYALQYIERNSPPFAELARKYEARLEPRQ